MRFLGIDYGTKRVGLSVSDEAGKVAFSVSVIPNNKKLIDEIRRLCAEKKVGGIVVGESHDFSGKENPIQKEIKKLAEKLQEEIQIPVHFEPEFLSSAQARKLGGAGNHNDAAAAAIILQSFLDRTKT